MQFKTCAKLKDTLMHIKFAMHTFIHLPFKGIVSFICTGYHYNIAMLCNMCVWNSLQNVEYLISDFLFDSSSSMNDVDLR